MSALGKLGACLVGPLLGAVGCQTTAVPNPQAVVFIDTDVPVAGQIASGPSLSGDPAIDVVRVEPIDATGAPAGTANDIVASDLLDWPLSFGVVSTSATAHFRIRAYRAALVTDPDDVNQAAAVIDRLVDVPVPSSGVGSVRVLLTGDCFGVKSDLLDRTTCVDAARLAGSPSDGVVALDGAPDPPTMAGTWAKAIAQACHGTAPSGTTCIAGGVTFLGDLGLTGTQDNINTFPSVPLRPVALRPFFLDLTEFTVGHFNSLVSELPSSFTLPLLPTSPGSPLNVACTWLGPGNTANDTKPLTCLPVATAAELCSLVGGRLPTEARWEHAARGRGQGRAYPWGDQTPACCSANVEFPLRGPFFTGTSASCPSPGAVAVGSFESDPCGGVNDVSRDGVLDLAGNVAEWVADQYYGYDDPCWGLGAPLDPMCPVVAASNNLARGSDFTGDNGNPIAGRAALRQLGLTAPGTGFRCAYDDGAP